MKTFQFLGASLKRRGVVMTTCISVISVVGVLLLSMFGSRSARSQELVQHELEVVADGVAESALLLAESEIWGGFRKTHGAEARSEAHFQSYLDSLGLTDGATGADADFRNRIGVHQNAAGAYPLGGGLVTRLVVLRQDLADGSEITIEVRASMGDGAPVRQLRRSYDSAGRSKEE